MLYEGVQRRGRCLQTTETLTLKERWHEWCRMGGIIALCSQDNVNTRTVSWLRDALSLEQGGNLEQMCRVTPCSQVCFRAQFSNILSLADFMAKPKFIFKS